MSSLFEIRQYPMLPSRLERFHQLMGGAVPGLFRRYGFAAPLGCWESHVGTFSPALIYGLVWDNLSQRDRAWSEFYSDADWKAALADNFAGAPRVDHAHVSLHAALMTPNGSGADRQTPWAELRFIDAGESLARSKKALDVLLPSIAARGGTIRFAFRGLWGRSRSEVALLIDWPSEEDATAADAPIPHSPQWREESQFMRPLPYLWPELQ